jgi:hypothetical protein
VRDLAARLRGDHVDVTLDRWHAAPGDRITAFMERAVRENDFVIAVCTPRFKERSDGRGGGVGYEGDIMTAYALTGAAEKKFIPVLRRGSWTEAAPTWLFGRAKIDLSGEPYLESEYEELLRTLHGAREEAPPLGPRPDFGTRQASSAPATASVSDQSGFRTPPQQSKNASDEIRAILRPLLVDRDSRRARLTHAFGGYHGLLDRISLDGETGVFLSNLIATLHSYGELEAGRPAICVLLESVKDEVGHQDRERIEGIVRDYPR